MVAAGATQGSKLSCKVVGGMVSIISTLSACTRGKWIFQVSGRLRGT
jgi:hypothetical protein